MSSNTYVALDTKVLGTAAASVTFTSIPQGYTDLVVVFNGSTTSGNLVKVQFNGDTTDSNYSSTLMWGNGSSPSSSRYSVGWTFVIPDAGNAMQNVLVNVMNYSNSTTYKTYLARANQPGASVTAAVGMWRNSAAITSLTLAVSGNEFTTGSTFTLYGVAAASAGAKATGGTIYQDASYFYHVFSGNGTFTPSQSISADVLVVAGGGAGGGPNAGGGGGAGGVCYQSGRSLTATGYTVTVGAGGAGTSSSTSNSGVNSTFDTITANGGGGSVAYANGTNGGSGGGGSYNSSTGGSATQGSSGGATGYGFAGGSGPNTGNQGAGGGGGAGAVGSNGTGTDGGAGGAGLNTWSSWMTSTGLGASGYIAGGGGGSIVYGTSGSSGAGGAGGGGKGGIYGSPNLAPVNGTAYTGSGGGGAGNSTSGAGGSGVVVIRYAK